MNLEVSDAGQTGRMDEQEEHQVPTVAIAQAAPMLLGLLMLLTGAAGCQSLAAEAVCRKSRLEHFGRTEPDIDPGNSCLTNSLKWKDSSHHKR